MTLLGVAPPVTDVCPLCGMAMLPLLFVSAGALVQLGCEAMSARRGVFAGVAKVTLAAGIVPSTGSHLSDGARFDYRPAVPFIRTPGSDVPGGSEEGRGREEGRFSWVP